jgi:hypothetical protein
MARTRAGMENIMNPSTTSPAPVQRELPLARARRELLLRDIEAAFDDYVALLATTRPGPGTNGWRSRIRRRVDALQTEHEAAELLGTMLEALDEHEFGPAGERHAT